MSGQRVPESARRLPYYRRYYPPIMDRGTPYEVLTQELFQTFLNQTQVLNIEVQHDVLLEGRSTKHQIDVYWKFEMAGIVHEVVVQTKDWNKSVDQGELIKFKGVLDDLPGQPRGIFVARAG